MGIDLLDVSFRLEKQTGVRLSHDDWMSLFRHGNREVLVGDLYSLLLARKHYPTQIRTDIELNERVWNKVRESLAVAANLDLSDIQMSTRLDELLPIERRREIWSGFESRCEYVPPQLIWNDVDQIRKSREERFEILAILLLPFLLITVGLGTKPEWRDPGSAFLLWVISSIVVGVGMLFRSWNRSRRYWELRRTNFPADVLTVKELCRRMRDLNITRLMPVLTLRQADRDLDLWNKLKQTLVDALGVDEDEVRQEAGLIRDLGME